jgi:hypothetical protein
LHGQSGEASGNALRRVLRLINDPSRSRECAGFLASFSLFNLAKTCSAAYYSYT